MGKEWDTGDRCAGWCVLTVPDPLLSCVHCGFCLAACPTYLELGSETDSPRGRIYLMRGLRDGKVGLTEDVVRHFDLCLGCRACETACPSGVTYGELIEETRVSVELKTSRPWRLRWRRFLVRNVIGQVGRLRVLLSFLRGLQAGGLLGFLRRWFPTVRLLPELHKSQALRALHPVRGERLGRVGLLPGCVAPELCVKLNSAAVRVLTRNGIEVFVPQEDLCCGALDLQLGDKQAARRLARQVVDAFPEDLDAVLVTAAGCGAAMKDYGRLLRDDSRYAARAVAFAGKVRDVTEYLGGLSLQVPEGRMEARIACHDPCHLAHAQGIRDAPRVLLNLIPGVELVELAESDVCCGSAGSYNLTETSMAERLRKRKTENIAASGATVVAAANPGCILQIQAGLTEQRLDIRVAHPVELVAEAYE